MDLPDHASANRDHWNDTAHEWVAMGERAWAADEPTWGCWGIADDEVRLLPDDLTGMRAIELGCGTGYVSAWMARRGAEVVAIDVSEQQLTTARRLADEHGIDIAFHHGSAESVPEPDGSFDFAVSEYGAAIWCDPYVWIPEAHRLLRPGGRLAFLGNHPFVNCCYPPNGDVAEPTLHLPYFGLHRQDWREVEIDPGGVEFNLPISAWMRLFADVGFAVDEFLELQVPDDVDDDRFAVPAAWGKRWPSEQVWKLTRR